MPQISIAVNINPTEDEERISQAIVNLFPEAKITIEGNMLNASAPNMDYFNKRMKQQNIRDSARKILFDSIEDSKIMFCLSKQATFVGKVNFTEGNSILGDIAITIKTENIEPNVLVQQMTGVL